MGGGLKGHNSDIISCNIVQWEKYMYLNQIRDLCGNLFSGLEVLVDANIHLVVQ